MVRRKRALFSDVGRGVVSYFYFFYVLALRCVFLQFWRFAGFDGFRVLPLYEGGKPPARYSNQGGSVGKERAPWAMRKRF